MIRLRSAQQHFFYHKRRDLSFFNKFLNKTKDFFFKRHQHHQQQQQQHQQQHSIISIVKISSTIIISKSNDPRSCIRRCYHSKSFRTRTIFRNRSPSQEVRRIVSRPRPSALPSVLPRPPKGPLLSSSTSEA